MAGLTLGEGFLWLVEGHLLTWPFLCRAEKRNKVLAFSVSHSKIHNLMGSTLPHGCLAVSVGVITSTSKAG